MSGRVVLAINLVIIAAATAGYLYKSLCEHSIKD